MTVQEQKCIILQTPTHFWENKTKIVHRWNIDIDLWYWLWRNSSDVCFSCYNNMFYSSNTHMVIFTYWFLWCAWPCERAMKEKEHKLKRNVPFPCTWEFRRHIWHKIFDNKIVATGQLCVMCMFVWETEFPMSLTLAWSGGWTDKLPLVTLNLCLGPCFIKGLMSEALLLSAGLLTFLQGLIQSVWTGRKWKEALHSTDKHSLTMCMNCLLHD